jgi:hypothetical protein
VGLQRPELDALLAAAVLDPGTRQVVEDGLLEGRPFRVQGGGLFADRPPIVEALGGGANDSDRCGDRLSTVKGPVTRTVPLSS